MHIYRRIAFWAGASLSAVGLWLFSDQDFLAVTGMLAMLLAGVIALTGLALRRHQYFSPVFFCSMYLLGYPAYLAMMWRQRDRYLRPDAGWDSVGLFGFSGVQIATLSIVSILILAGLCVGGELVRRRWCPTVARRWRTTPRRVMYTWLVAWGGASSALILVMGQLGIGRVTLNDAVGLPWHLNGILYWTRSVVVPMVGMAVLQMAAEAGRRRDVVAVLVMFLLVGAAGSLTSLSRVYIFLLAGPAFIYLSTLRAEKIRLRVVPFMIALLVFGTLLASAVTSLRNLGFEQNRLRLTDLTAVLGSETGRPEVGRYSDLLVELLTTRQGGARELALAMQSRTSTRDVWRYFVSDPGFEFAQDIWGFHVDNPGEGVFGIGFAGLSWLYFGQSWLVVFFGAVVQGAFVVGWEAAFERRGWRGPALAVGFYLALRVWNSWYWEWVWKAAVTYAVTFILLEGIRRFRWTLSPQPHRLGEISTATEIPNVGLNA